MFGRGLMELCHIVNIKYHSAVRTDDGIGVLWLEPSILKYMPPWNVLDSQNIWEAPFGFHHLFNWKESYFEGFIREWRNVSREREVDKKIDLCRQSHALWFTLQGDSISLREKLPQAVKVICLLFSPTDLQESAGICRWLHPPGSCAHNDVPPVNKRSWNKANDIYSIWWTWSNFTVTGTFYFFKQSVFLFFIFTLNVKGSPIWITPFTMPALCFSGVACDCAA